MPNGKWIESIDEIITEIEFDDWLDIVPNTHICLEPQKHTNDDHPFIKEFEIEWVFAGAKYATKS